MVCLSEEEASTLFISSSVPETVLYDALTLMRAFPPDVDDPSISGREAVQKINNLPVGICFCKNMNIFAVFVNKYAKNGQIACH